MVLSTFVEADALKPELELGWLCIVDCDWLIFVDGLFCEL